MRGKWNVHKPRSPTAALDALWGWARADAARWHLPDTQANECRDIIAKRISELEAENARLRTVTPAMLAAAWAVWKPRHPKLRLGPGPAFKEALEAAIKEAGR